MKEKSLSSKLSWRIILIALVISILSQLAATIVIANGSIRSLQWWRESPKLLIYLNLIAIGSFVILYFVSHAVIKRVTRYSEELEAAKQANVRMEADLTLARDIQMGMLPKEFPPFLYAFLCPAKKVGGDLYDFILKDDELYFALGDVSGKGLPSSLIMAIMSGILHLMDGMGLTMDETLRRVNDNFSKSNQTGMFVTLFVARLNLKTGHLDYCNGGHCPLLIIPPDSDPYLLKSKPNLAIGMFEHFEYEAEQIDLKPGTRIIAYTDGVTEAEREDMSQYGNERLLQWAKHIAEEFPATSSSLDNSQEKTIVESLFASVNAFAEGNPQNDDITIMSVRI